MHIHQLCFFKTISSILKLEDNKSKKDERKKKKYKTCNGSNLIILQSL